MENKTNDNNNWISEVLANGVAFIAMAVFYSLIIFAVIILLVNASNIIERIAFIVEYSSNAVVFTDRIFSLFGETVKTILLVYCQLPDISISEYNSIDSFVKYYYLIPPIILLISGFLTSSPVKGIKSIISGASIGLPYAIIMAIIGLIGSITLFDVTGRVETFEIFRTAFVSGILFGGIGGVIGMFFSVDPEEE